MTRNRNHSRPTPVSRILQGVLRECGLDGRLNEREPLLAWREIVGSEIADHSRAVDLDDGILVLDADHGAWRQELNLLIPEIMNKFNARFGPGTVTEIRWRGGPGRGRKRNVAK